MKNYSVQQCALGILMILSLAACSGGGRYADIDAFMAEIEARPKGQIAPLPVFEPYQPFTYSSANRRSPFEAPVVIPKKKKGQVKNAGVKPPANHAKEYLERFNLASLMMVGTLSRGEDSWALIEDSQGGIHRVQVGDYLGANWGQIDEIAPSRIDLTEIVSDGSDGWLLRPRSLELKGD
ncbi:MAG: pilus assembly protein PilP [Gammaproteobacteria bacterium]|nr:pilus assembly protein PilP [Gammaproteobacteria bacterium]